MRRKWLVISVAAVVALGLIAIGIYYFVPSSGAHRERLVVAKPEAPPDLAKLRDVYSAGLDALQCEPQRHSQRRAVQRRAQRRGFGRVHRLGFSGRRSRPAPGRSR